MKGSEGFSAALVAAIVVLDIAGQSLDLLIDFVSSVVQTAFSFLDPPLVKHILGFIS